MSKEHKVVIIEGHDSEDNKVCWVVPGRLVASAGDAVLFKVNRSVGGPVEITPPDFLVPGRPSPIVLNSGQSELRRIAPDAEEGAYPYTVFCKHLGANARGASEPEIIVDN
ncbi:MAG: hypothetical protein HXY20_14545 [Acidobacteria bacterium]|nr:hypothetical protein [Acidobacteriota bacterium]